MRLMRATLALALSLAFLGRQSAAYAHEGWFVEKGEHAGEYFSLDWIMLLIAGGVILFLASAAAIERHSWLCRLAGLCGKAQGFLPAGIEWRLVAFLSGAMLIANSVTGVFLAPNLALSSPELVVLGGVAQAVVGFLLLTQFSFLIPGLAILVIALPLAAIYLEPALLVDYLVEFVALGAALVFFGMRSSVLDRFICRRLGYCRSHSQHLPVTVVRIGLGLSLVILALHNKLLSPDLALTFLDKHDFNFLPYLGLTEFSNLHFVFAAGMMEVALGLLLASGIATRFAAASMAMFMLTTMAVLGLGELVGHLPLLGIAILLLYRGPGQYHLATATEGPEAVWVGRSAFAQSWESSWRCCFG